MASSSGNGYKLPNFTANGIAYAKTEKGDQEITKEQKVERIDRLSPQIIKVVKGEVLNQTQQLSIVMTGNADSGVAAYYVGNSSTKPAVDATSWTEYKLPPMGASEQLRCRKRSVLIMCMLRIKLEIFPRDAKLL